MKVEKRGDYSAFISHSGLTIFANRTPKGYTLKVTTRDESNTWNTAGIMDIAEADFKIWAKLLETL